MVVAMMRYCGWRFCDYRILCRIADLLAISFIKSEHDNFQELLLIYPFDNHKLHSELQSCSIHVSLDLGYLSAADAGIFQSAAVSP